jgi:hypothetical protein
MVMGEQPVLIPFCTTIRSDKVNANLSDRVTHKDVAIAANGLLDASAATSSPTDGDRGARKPDLGATSGRGSPRYPKSSSMKGIRTVTIIVLLVFQITGGEERNLTSMVLEQHWMLPVLHSLTWRTSSRSAEQWQRQQGRRPRR